MYTYPSGEFIPLIVGAIILVSAAINVYNNWDDITGGTGKFSDIKWSKFGGYATVGGISGALTVYGGPYGVVWAGGFQGLGNSLIKGDDMQTTLQNVGIGLASGAVARYVNVKFDTTFAQGLLGGNNMLNSVVSESTKAIFSNFSANFSAKFIESGFNGKFDFEESFRYAANPTNMIMSGVSGGLTGAHNYNISSSPTTPSIYIESFRLIPNPPIVPVIRASRGVVPPSYMPIQP